MKTVFNKIKDIAHIQRVNDALKTAIIAVDSSATADMDKTKPVLEQLREAAIQNPKLFTVIETEEELTLEYAEDFVEKYADFLVAITPKIIPIAKAFFDLTELCTGVFGEIKQEAMRCFAKFIPKSPAQLFAEEILKGLEKFGQDNQRN